MKVKLTLETAKAPERANPTDAGADLFSPESRVIKARDYKLIDLGIQLEIPEGYAGFIYARSGLGSRNGIKPRNCVGVIDSKYRGNVMIMLNNDSNRDYVIGEGERIAQLVIAPVAIPEFEVVEELDMTDDRKGGFGSTGK